MDAAVAVRVVGLCHRDHDGAGDGATGDRDSATAIWFGTANTAILLAYSATVPVWAREERDKPHVLIGLALTGMPGLAFMVMQTAEIWKDISESLCTGTADFPVDQPGVQVLRCSCG